MSVKHPQVSFERFCKKFPVVELPIILSAESQIAFSRDNPTLHPLEVDAFIGQVDTDMHEEIVPCFQLPGTDTFRAVVYWRARLLRYEYVLATYSLKGELLSRKVIAGMQSDTKTIMQRAVTIDEDWHIYTADSKIGADEQVANVHHAPVRSKSFELIETGDILEY